MDRFSFLANKRAIALANLLLNEEGKLINLDRVEPRYLILPEGYNDGDITLHFQRVISFLKKSSELRILIQSFSLPICDKKYEEMIALTLDREEITDRDLIWGVLSALLCPIRQHVGSCFATAPAILVHEEQLRQFLLDLKDLLMKARFTRVIAGVEYTVPVSPSAGLGDLKRPFYPDHPGAQKLHLKGEAGQSFLEVVQKKFPKEKQQRAMLTFVAQTDHLLLKIWEYTIASFVDVKSEFSRWNLYSSLGVHPEERGGIGELIYNKLEQDLQEANQKLLHFQTEYEIAFDQVRMIEALLRGVTSEAELRRLKAEHIAKVYHLRSCEEMRDTMNQKAQSIADYFPFLLEQIAKNFEKHFQEVYDPEMQEMTSSLYDDAQAGFRLLYKHGRTNAGSWTFIHSAKEYIQALKDFFLSIETPIKEHCKWEWGKDETTSIITAIIYHIGTEEFLTSSFYRMAKAHKVPLQKIPLEKMEKKPWAYTSGGTLPTLLKTYFRREGSLTEEARWVESPTDLLIFILETLKSLPPLITNQYIRDPTKRMLMTSPTHVFSLLPGQESFRKGWEDPGFTYTWVRDHAIQPGLNFYRNLEVFEQRLLVQEFNISYSPEKPLSIVTFRNKLPQGPDIDAKLFEFLPIIHPSQMREIYEEVKIKEKHPDYPMFRKAFHDLVISHLPSESARDLHLELAKVFQKRGLSPPPPLLFADTNWSKFYFSFLVSPASKQLELWRTDKIGLTGAPMREWEPFLNGTIKHPWTMYPRSYEYTM